MSILTGVIAITLFSSCSKEISQDEEPSNHVETVVVETISDLTDTEILDVTDLTITGNIQGEDWNVLFVMSHLGKLKRLDMSDASIIGIHDGSHIWNDNEIPEYKFEGSKTLEEVNLPKSLKSIGQEAFSGCSKLRKVQFGNSVDSIASRAFYKAPLQGEFTIPTSLKVIGRQAFAETNITKVIINSDVCASKYQTSYALHGNSVFANCSNLNEVIVAEGCTSLELGFAYCENLTTVSLPNTLKKIGYESSSSQNEIFKHCSSLEEIQLPKCLWFIGESAFAKTSLKKVIIPDAVEYIWTFAFNDCEQLEEVSMSNNIIKLGYCCFEGCRSLNKLQLPESLKVIDSRAFKDCVSLREVIFGKNINSIGRNAFSNCSSLLSIVLPTNLEILGTSSFEDCSALTHVILNNKLEELQSSTFKNCTSLHDLSLGSSIKMIGSSCFYNCSNLSKVDIPISVNSFSDFAFAYSGLQEIKVHWTFPIQINGNIFTGLNLTHMQLEVPVKTKNSYLNSSVWGEFGDIQEAE